MKKQTKKPAAAAPSSAETTKTSDTEQLEKPPTTKKELRCSNCGTTAQFLTQQTSTIHYCNTCKNPTTWVKKEVMTVETKSWSIN